MKASKKKRLEAAGWRVGSTAELLGLTPEEAAFIEVEFALRHLLRERRRQMRLTQAELAKRLGSSQSRVAKIEAGDRTVSLDLLMRAVLATGATISDMATALTPPRRRRVARRR